MAQIKQLHVLLNGTANKIVSYINSVPILKQACAPSPRAARPAPVHMRLARVLCLFHTHTVPNGSWTIHATRAPPHPSCDSPGEIAPRTRLKDHSFIVSCFSRPDHSPHCSRCYQAAHAKKLEDNPQWTLVLGIGYSDGQKNNTIYSHLKTMLTELQRVTGGDATKAKQLVDLLYTRAHAGEDRRVNATEKAQAHEHAVNAGIVASITAFVQALHDASGDGRYPDKVRKAQQVICTAVSKAAVLSSTNTSIREIGAKLGLSERMISKCKVPPTQS